MLHLTPDTWHLKHLTCDTWHMTLTYDTWWGVNILSKCQLPSSNGLRLMISWRLGGKGWVTEWISYKAFCRTAPTSSGLLIICHWFQKLFPSVMKTCLCVKETSLYIEETCQCALPMKPIKGEDLWYVFHYPCTGACDWHMGPIYQAGYYAKSLEFCLKLLGPIFILQECRNEWM